MYKTPKNKIEEMLGKYPILRSNAMIKLRNSHREYSLQAMDYTQPTTSNTNVVYSDVESYVISVVGNKQISDDLINIAMSIEEAMGCLYDNEREVIKCKYFEGLSDREIKDELGKSESTIQRYKTEALNKLLQTELVYFYDKFVKAVKEIKQKM